MIKFRAIFILPDVFGFVSGTLRSENFRYSVRNSDSLYQMTHRIWRNATALVLRNLALACSGFLFPEVEWLVTNCQSKRNKELQFSVFSQPIIVTWQRKQAATCCCCRYLLPATAFSCGVLCVAFSVVVDDWAEKISKNTVTWPNDDVVILNFAVFISFVDGQTDWLGLTTLHGSCEIIQIEISQNFILKTVSKRRDADSEKLSLTYRTTTLQREGFLYTSFTHK